MSASGYKQTCGGVSDYVRFTPNSGLNRVWRGMSAFDPKRTLVTRECPSEKATILKALACRENRGLPYSLRVIRAEGPEPAFIQGCPLRKREPLNRALPPDISFKIKLDILLPLISQIWQVC